MLLLAFFCFTNVLLVRGETEQNVRNTRSSVAQGCNGTLTLTEPQGTISSPKFPTLYDPNILCSWLIQVEPDNRLSISFKFFHLEDHNNCDYDSLEIYDGISDTAALLGKFCGPKRVLDVRSTSNQVYIRFKSDNSGGYPGFKLEYRTICGNVYTELAGVLTSPSYPEAYSANLTCVYEIQLPPGYLVDLTIHNIDIEPHQNCKFDYLEVRDGNSEKSHLATRLCGNRPPESIVSTYNFLWLKFKTDANVHKLGFFAKYEAIDIGCGGLVTRNYSQIKSPGYPRLYPKSITCNWLIQAPERCIVLAMFSKFALQYATDCANDYVSFEATDGVKIGKFCGKERPPALKSSDNKLIVQFVSDDTVAGDGFVLDYEFIDSSQTCGGHFHQDYGIIRFPGYLNHLPDSVRCVWVLHAENSSQITLRVTNFNMEYYPNCEDSFLEIRDGNKETSALIGKFCENQFVPVIRSHNNALWLKLVGNSVASEDGSGNSNFPEIGSGDADSSDLPPGIEIYFNSFECFCGEGHDCDILDDKKVCICMDKYQDNNGTCEECECRPDQFCEFRDGSRTCILLHDSTENKGHFEGVTVLIILTSSLSAIIAFLVTIVVIYVIRIRRRLSQCSKAESSHGNEGTTVMNSMPQKEETVMNSMPEKEETVMNSMPQKEETVM